MYIRRKTPVTIELVEKVVKRGACGHLHEDLVPVIALPKVEVKV
ncbi:hypothetical protein ATG_06060 [Desulfurococcaceae archaeon AG1]|nr:hypothetical protein ATG_06060 [Desulfurococcaceae archaeon AG1]